MRNTLYVANLAPDIAEEQLRELFGQYGEVTSVEIGDEKLTEGCYALVQMAKEKSATKSNHSLNGHELDGRYIAISYLEPDTSKRLTNKQRKVAEEIAVELNETEKVPLRQIHTMVLLCGTSFVQAILEDALRVEAGEGLMTSDGSRKRTKGGVFFYLARGRVSKPVRHIIFNRKGKLPVEQESEPEEAKTAESDERADSTI